MPGKFNVVRHEANTSISATYSAAAVAGHALTVTGAKEVGPAGAGKVTVGTSHHDVAATEKGSLRLKGDIVPMIADAAIVAGDMLFPGATAGRVKKRDAAAPEAAEYRVGVAWTAAAAAGDEVLVIVV
jgi:hypothetical protein